MDPVAAGAAVGATVGLAFPAAAAASIALGAFVGGVIDVAGVIGDAISSVADDLGIHFTGPGSVRTSLRAQLAPALATIVREVTPEQYEPAMLACVDFLEHTIVPSFDSIAHFADDPTFVADTIEDVAALAPIPPGARTLSDYFAGVINGTIDPLTGAPIVKAAPPRPVSKFGNIAKISTLKEPTLMPFNPKIGAQTHISLGPVATAILNPPPVPKVFHTIAKERLTLDALLAGQGQPGDRAYTLAPGGSAALVNLRPLTPTGLARLAVIDPAIGRIPASLTNLLQMVLAMPGSSPIGGQGVNAGAVNAGALSATTVQQDLIKWFAWIRAGSSSATLDPSDYGAKSGTNDADGDPGDRTRRAMVSFANWANIYMAAGMPTDGAWDNEYSQSMLEAWEIASRSDNVLSASDTLTSLQMLAEWAASHPVLSWFVDYGADPGDTKATDGWDLRHALELLSFQGAWNDLATSSDAGVAGIVSGNGGPLKPDASLGPKGMQALSAWLELIPDPNVQPVQPDPNVTPVGPVNPGPVTPVGPVNPGPVTPVGPVNPGPGPVTPVVASPDGDELQFQILAGAWAKKTGAADYGDLADFTGIATDRFDHAIAAFQPWANKQMGLALRTDGILDQQTYDALAKWADQALEVTPAPSAGGGGAGILFIGVAAVALMAMGKKKKAA